MAGWMPGEGPRDKLLERGAQALSDAELLAVLLHTGYRDCSALDMARNMLNEFLGLSGVMQAPQANLLACRGMGPGKYALLQAAQELVRRQALQTISDGDVLSSPGETRRFLQYHLGGHNREVFSCLFLDSQHRVLRCEDLFFGTLDGAAVYPREVAVRALQYDAAAIIFAHNHPSGVAEPSRADMQLTRRLSDALGLIDVRVLDHMVIGSETVSFAERGLI